MNLSFLFVTVAFTKGSLLVFIHEANADFRQEPLATSMLQFSDVRPRKTLSGSVFKTKCGLSVVQCALECNHNFQCLSFNFRGRSVCELSEADVFSIGVKNQHLLIDEIGVVYYGMERDSVPACKETGYQRNIGEDSAGICRINGKRVDREWSEWEQKSNVTGEGDYFEFLWREIIVDYAHGGIKGEDQFRIVEQQLRIVGEAKNWYNAVSYCQWIGGQLFSDLDGTVEQLNTLVALQGGQSFWLGLELEEGQYHRVGGGILPWNKILWSSAKPDQSPGEVHLLVLGGSNRVDDMWTQSLLVFFCDMLY